MSEPTGIIPHLVCKGAAQAIEYYKKALGAEEIMRTPEQNGTRLMHAQLQIGPATLYLCDDFPEYCGGTSRAAPGSSASRRRSPRR